MKKIANICKNKDLLQEGLVPSIGQLKKKNNKLLNEISYMLLNSHTVQKQLGEKELISCCLVQSDITG